MNVNENVECLSLSTIDKVYRLNTDGRTYRYFWATFDSPDGIISNSDIGRAQEEAGFAIPFYGFPTISHTENLGHGKIGVLFHCQWSCELEEFTNSLTEQDSKDFCEEFKEYLK